MTSEISVTTPKSNDFYNGRLISLSIDFDAHCRQKRLLPHTTASRRNHRAPTIKMKTTIYALFVCILLAAASSPARAQIAVIGSLAHDQEVSPGSRYSGTVEIHNNGTEPRQAKVFQTDYSFGYDGSNRFDAPGSVSRSNADWIVFSPSFVTIPPGESVPVVYEVSVPADTANAYAGSYWSVLMIEDVPPDSPESTVETNRDEIQIGLREVFRYAVQLATHIRENEQYAIEFVGVGLAEEAADHRVLEVAVANSGNMFVRPDVWIEVFDSEGEKRAKIDSKPARLYPDTSVSHVFDLSEFEKGDYEVLVVVDAGDENVFGAQYTVAL